MHSSRKKSIVSTAIVIAILSAAVAAYAYFTNTGQGTGSATTGAASPFVVSSTADAAGDLVPVAAIGSGVEDTVSYTVTNPSAGAVKLSTVAISIGTSTGTSPSLVEGNWSATAGSYPACNSSDFSVGGQAVGNGTTAGSGVYTVSPNVDLAAGAVYNGTFTLQMIDNNANQDSCESVTVPLYIAAS